MLKISKLTDYAAIILIHLEQHKKVISSSALAVETGIPEPTVAKVLKMLTRSLLVKSSRGAGSGYVLQRPLDQITLAFIISIFDGPIELVNCDREHCRITTVDCQLHGKWDLISGQVRKIFETVTLEGLKNNCAATEVTNESRCSSPTSLNAL